MPRAKRAAVGQLGLLPTSVKAVVEVAEDHELVRLARSLDWASGPSLASTSASTPGPGRVSTACERSRNRRWPAGMGRGWEGRELPGLPEVALRLREVLDECDRLHAPPAALTAEGIDVPHPAKEARPRAAVGERRSWAGLSEEAQAPP